MMMNRFIKRYLSLHFFLWILIPTLLISSLPFDVVEIISWGKQWQWGYYKHPPLPAWLLYPFYQVFGNIGPFLLSQLSIALTLGCIYLLGRRLLDNQRALFGCFALLGIFYFTFPSLEFNHNLGQMPLWAACVLFFERAITTWSWPYWLLLGVMAAAGLLMKYSTLMLLASMAIYMLITPELRRRIFDIKVLTATALMFVIVLPHLLWLHSHDYLPLHYAAARATSAKQSSLGLNQFKFILAQFIDHLPLIFALIFAGLWRPSYWGGTSKHLRFLVVLGIGPALLTFIGAMASGAKIHTMWGAPMWNLSGLLIAASLKPEAIKAHFSRFVYSLSAIVFAITLVMVIYLQYGSAIQKRPSRTDWPAKAMGQAIDQKWTELSGCALKVVSGNYWIGGLISQSSNFQPSVFISGNKEISPWIKQKTLDNYGWIAVWEDNESPPTLPARSSDMKIIQGEISFSWPKQINYPPLLLHWQAVIPLSCLRTEAS